MRNIRTIKAAVFLLLLLLLSALAFIYLYSKPKKLTSHSSPTGKYAVIVYEVRSPGFFSASECRAVLKSGHKKIDSMDFSVANDGGKICADNFEFEWKSDCVKITTHGSEQSDKSYYLFYY